MLRSVLCLGLLLCVGSAHGELLYYLGADNGSWHEASGWTAGRAPIADDTVRIIDGKTVRITADGSSDHLTVGHYGDGHIIQEGGAVDMRLMYVGSAYLEPAYQGTYIFNGGSLDVDDLRISSKAPNSTFTQRAGNLTGREIRVGFGQGEQGSFTLHSGSVDIERLFLGNYGGTMGIFTQESGAMHIRKDINFGGGSGANTAIYNLQNGTLRIDGYTPFRFNVRNSEDEVHFNFDGGALFLEDIWDLDRLTAIPRFDLQVSGAPPTAENLHFEWAVVDNLLYTKVSHVPEPSTFVLLAIGAAGLMMVARRKRRRA